MQPCEETKENGPSNNCRNGGREKIVEAGQEKCDREDGEIATESDMLNTAKEMEVSRDKIAMMMIHKL